MTFSIYSIWLKTNIVDENIVEQLPTTSNNKQNGWTINGYCKKLGYEN